MSGKNRKFDRNRKRSKSMARYNGERREEKNKRLKISRHLKDHPKDKTVHGTVPDFKVKHHKYEPVKPDLMWDVDGYWNKKELRINVPNAMYVIIAVPPGVVVEYSHLLKDCKEAFKKVKCRAMLVKVTSNNLVEVLDMKESLPMLSQKDRMSYGKAQLKQEAVK